MTFAWPPMLLALLLLPFGVLGSRAIGRRRRETFVRRAGSGFAAGTSATSGPRTWMPAALLVLGLAVLAIALARPQGVVSLPRQEGIVILAFDVSGSMAADDLKPTRMEAAKAAARAFVERQPSSVVVGVVAFSDAGLTVQVPTSDQAAVEATINRLAPTRGTALATGISAALDAIAKVENPPPTNYYNNRSPEPSAAPTPAPVPAGSDRSAAIVLLTDGENNENPDPSQAAADAANAGVRIYTVGIGSPDGATLDINGFRVHTQLDEPALQQIADVTGGTYYHAADADQLHAIYDQLNPRLSIQPQALELTPLFAGAALLLLVFSGTLSYLWLGRLP